MSLEAWGDDGMDMCGPEGYVTEERAQEYFVGGLVAMREMLAQFIESQDPTMAQSIRANWKPEWGKDPGKPDSIYLDGAIDAAMASTDGSAPSAIEPMTERERITLSNLLQIARAIYYALDDSEERGKEIILTLEHYNLLNLGLACLDDLPDDKPGYAMGPAAKAAWALRRIIGIDYEIPVASTDR